jgi:hypothetical protein
MPIDDNFGRPAAVPQRIEKVRALMEAANAGMMAEAQEATSEEVVSACVTLAAVAIEAAYTLGASPAALRGLAQQLLLRCPGDEGDRVN